MCLVKNSELDFYFRIKSLDIVLCKIVRRFKYHFVITRCQISPGWQQVADPPICIGNSLRNRQPFIINRFF